MSETVETSKAEYKDLIRKSTELDMLLDFLLDIATLSYDKKHLYFSFPENFLIRNLAELRCADRMEQLLEEAENGES